MTRLNNVWKLYLAYSLLLVVGMTAGGFILSNRLQAKLTDHLVEDLLTLSRLVAQVLPESQDRNVLDAFCRKYQALSGARITIIRPDGQVIGESRRQSLSVQNHLDRPEVRAAVAGEVGRAVRFSQTLGRNMMYVAVPSPDAPLVLRLGLPTTEVKRIENQVMIFLALAIYLIPLLTMIVSFLFARLMAASDGKSSPKGAEPPAAEK